jgi:hypothetical protein
MLAAKRIAQFTNFDTSDRRHTPRTAAEDLTRALGFDFKEEHTRGENIRDVLESIFGQKSSFTPQQVGRIGDVWDRMTAQSAPISIVIENEATGDLVVSHRDRSGAVEAFTESAAIMRTVFQAIFADFGAAEAFPDATSTDFLTEAGEARYHDTAELYRSLEAAERIGPIRESLRTDAAEMF